MNNEINEKKSRKPRASKKINTSLDDSKKSVDESKKSIEVSQPKPKRIMTQAQLEGLARGQETLRKKREAKKQALEASQ